MKEDRRHHSLIWFKYDEIQKLVAITVLTDGEVSFSTQKDAKMRRGSPVIYVWNCADQASLRLGVSGSAGKAHAQSPHSGSRSSERQLEEDESRRGGSQLPSLMKKSFITDEVDMADDGLIWWRQASITAEGEVVDESHIWRRKSGTIIVSSDEGRKTDTITVSSDEVREVRSGRGRWWCNIRRQVREKVEEKSGSTDSSDEWRQPPAKSHLMKDEKS